MVLQWKISKYFQLYRAYGSFMGLFAIGGFTGSSSLATSEKQSEYDGTWHKAFPDLPVKVHEHCIASLPSGETMIIGGIVEGRPSKKTYYSSYLQKRWHSGPELNVPRSGASCGGVNDAGQVIVAGGYNDDGYLHSSEVTCIRDANLPMFKVSLLIAQTRSSE